MAKNTSWGNVRVRQDLIDRMTKALHTAELQREGFTNVAQLTDNIIRKALASLEAKRFEHINMYEDHVKILDNHIGRQGRIISVYYKENMDPICEYCEDSDCVHIQYAWEIGAVRDILKQLGFKPPS